MIPLLGRLPRMHPENVEHMAFESKLEPVAKYCNQGQFAGWFTR